MRATKPSTSCPANWPAPKPNAETSPYEPAAAQSASGKTAAAQPASAQPATAS